MDGRLIDLSHLIDDQEWIVTSAIAINESGTILAYARQGGGDEQPVLLRRIDKE